MVPSEGDTRTVTRTFTADDVSRFAEFSGDDQPRHTEPRENGELMVQGLLTATLPTEVGSDDRVLAHTMEVEFSKPVYTNEQVECHVFYESVTEKDKRYDVTMDITCSNPENDIVLTGSINGIIWKE